MARLRTVRKTLILDFNINQIIAFIGNPKQTIVSKTKVLSEISKLFKISKTPKTAKNFEKQLNKKLALIFFYFQHKLKQNLPTPPSDPNENNSNVCNNVISPNLN
jgi:hypothetical protein